MNLSVGGRSTDELVSRQDPDGELLVQSRQDPEAFGEFYDRTHKMVLRYFLVRTACASTSADLCAETFAGALEGVDRFEPSKGTGRGWLTGIAKNIFRQYVRKEHVSRRARERLGIGLSSYDMIDLERIESLVDFRPRIAVLSAALHRLPEPTRIAVVLRIVDELSYEEIAARMGITRGNARVRVCRGLDKLEEMLGGDDD